jgi:hypothetical protein
LCSSARNGNSLEIAIREVTHELEEIARTDAGRRRQVAIRFRTARRNGFVLAGGKAHF